MKKMTIRRISYDAVLAAFAVALGYFSLDFGDIKLTFENFPIIIAAFLFGPLDGSLVGLIGIFLSQLLRYGVDLSTPLWILPYVLSGLFIGLIAKIPKLKKENKIPVWAIFMILIFNAILVTGVNSICLVIYNAYILGVGRAAALAGVIAKLPLRIMTNILKAVIFSLVMIPLLKAARAFLTKEYKIGLF